MSNMYKPKGSPVVSTTLSYARAPGLRSAVRRGPDALAKPQSDDARSLLKGGAHLPSDTDVQVECVDNEYARFRKPFTLRIQTIQRQGTSGPGRQQDALEAENAELKREIARLRALLSQTVEAKPDPLAGALARGAAYMKTEYASKENLTLADASEYSGRSDRIVNRDRNRGALYALVPEGNTRGYRFPKWQFDVSTARLRPVLDVLRAANLGGWAIHAFLTTPHSGLDEQSPAGAIADQDFPLSRIIEVAQARVDPHQGAS